MLNKEEEVPDVLSIDVDKIDNAVLRRLITEVKSDKLKNVDAYNRCHNRHNRSRVPYPSN